MGNPLGVTAAEIWKPAKNDHKSEGFLRTSHEDSLS